VEAGCAFDTDFRTTYKGRFAYGTGIRLQRPPRLLGFEGHVQYTAGYSGFAGAADRNHWHLGLRVLLHKAFVPLPD